jgi:transcriptional regulator with XRE-family HTH domain
MRLKEILEKKGISPRSASLRAGLRPDAARAILAGRSQRPGTDTLKALAHGLDVLPEALLRPDQPLPDLLPGRDGMIEIREAVSGRMWRVDGAWVAGARSPIVLWGVWFSTAYLLDASIQQPTSIPAQFGVHERQSLRPPEVATIYMEAGTLMLLSGTSGTPIKPDVLEILGRVMGTIGVKSA